MDELLTCAQGHRWDPSASTVQDPVGATLTCPICGAAGTASRLARHAAHAGAETPAPGTAGNAADHATVTHGPRSAVPTDVLSEALDGGIRQPPARLPGVPGYELVRVLGRGGMGVVYLARHLGLNRLVALKMILAGGHASPADIARFKAEARAVAQLQHPNIVQIYEIGEHEGRPYFSLEYVEGGSLARRFDGTPLPPRTAAALVATLARAVAYAHQQGVVHRDLKPANILLLADGVVRAAEATAHDVPLTPHQLKITDFGLAKRIGDDSGPTQSGDIMGTPSYMAPEQASGRSKATGPPADIYALGAILYELLTGRPPFKSDTLIDTLRQVTSEEPVPPARLHPKVPRDLETICLKCLQKEPHKRYASAEALANDLERFLDGRPILARPTPLWERAAKWAARRPAAAALIAVGAVAVVGAVLGVLGYAAEVRRHSDEVRGYNVRLQAEVQRADSERDRAEAREQETRRHWYVADLNLARQIWQQAHIARTRELLRRHIPRSGQEDLRGFEWHYLWRLCHSARLSLDFDVPVTCVAIAPDGSLLAAGTHNGIVRRCDPSTGKELPPLKLSTHAISSLSFAPDGQTLAVGSLNRTAFLVNPHTGEQHATLTGHRAGVLAVAFAPDGQTLASVGAERVVIFWDVPTRRLRFSVPVRHVYTIAYAPDGKTLAAATLTGSVLLLDPATGKERSVLAGPAKPVAALAFAPDGKTLAAAGDDRAVRLWDLPPDGPPRERTVLAGHTDEVRALAFAADGKTLASAGLDATIRLWDAAAGRPLWVIRGHCGPVWGLAFHPDGRTLASGGFTDGGIERAGELKLWDTAREQEKTVLAAHTRTVLAVAFARDGRTLATAGLDGQVKLWDAVAGQELRAFEAHNGPVSALAFSPDGAILATAGADKVVKLWSVPAGQELRTLAGHTHPVAGIAFAPDGTRLASVSADKTIRLWEVATGRAVQVFETDGVGGPLCVAFAPDGRTLATGHFDGSLRVWDLAAGKPAGVFQEHRQRILAVAFAPDGTHLATAGDDTSVRLWEVAGWKVRTVLRGHRGEVGTLAFTPDGRALVSGSGEVRLWDLATLEERAMLSGEPHRVGRVAVSPDGRRLAAGCADGALLVWDATPP